MASNARRLNDFEVGQETQWQFRSTLLWLVGRVKWSCFGLFWLCMLLLSYSGQAARNPESMPFRFKRAKLQQVSIPYKAQNDLIIVSAKLNGQGPFNFLLDTGAASSIITDPKLGQALGLQSKNSYSLAGVGTKAPVTAYRTKPVRVDLAGIEAPAFTFITVTENVLDLASLMGTPVHGILGYDLFRSFVVTIQPRLSRVTFTDPALAQPPKGKRWTSLPLRLEDAKPYITTNVVLGDSQTVPLKLVVDTGAGHALSLETASDPRLQLPANRVRSELGRSLSGPIMGYLGRVQALQLGCYQVRSLLTSFPDSSNLAHRIQVPRNGTLGFETLRRFDIVIDYPHNQLLLRPNGLQRQPFEHDMSGVRLLASGPDYREYTIASIEPNSSAAAAGLRQNDKLVLVGVMPAEGLTLAQISQLFHSQDGRNILLVVRREDGELFSTSLQLKRRI
ncbi:aspartyl protease family protein [Hymenobacter cavernae]|uniref:Peptidase A2 domain-containing protein n=1 Tax=Hymenobacter cavernae TaxID=2044852 RepID=A0ABQ1UHE4_9BACT|nr:aspartyl protease family protein [Hymenobacter cavernae]GGF18106.1 hypothetical protein GCM10011383_31990 [Hymenobacter cavernae]